MSSSRTLRSAVSLAMGVLLVAGACNGSPNNGSVAASDRRPPARELERQECNGVRKLVRRVRRGYYPWRAPDISWIPREPNYVGSASMPVHSGPWDYLMDVPIVLYGPGHIRSVGEVDSSASIADMAATAAKLVRYGDWPRRDGRILGGPLTGRDTPPRLVLQIVWDGGGWNVLNEHPGKWPYLKQLMGAGANFTHATVGTSPSVTPPIHANLGTGAWPRRHGIAGLRIRAEGTFDYINPFGRLNGDNLEKTTLADLYDRARGNRPVTGMLGSVNWHLGMIGHGSKLPGGDKDPVALLDRHDGGVNSNTSIYSLPAIADPDQALEFADKVDSADGSKDGKWMGHPIRTHEEIHFSPAMPLFEEYMLERLVRKERFGADGTPDLLYVNFKTADVAGHRWGMTSDEVGSIIRYQDRALKRLVRFLNRRVGERKWVLMLTADHGQTPYPKESGAWPIYGGEVARDANRRFDNTKDGVALIDKAGSAGLYVHKEDLAENGTTMKKIARWVGNYTLRENVKGGDPVPKAYESRADELLFDAVLVRQELVAISCTE